MLKPLKNELFSYSFFRCLIEHLFKPLACPCCDDVPSKTINKLRQL